MSWYRIDSLTELTPQLKGNIELTFTCPRCNKEQTIIIDAGYLLYGFDFQCNNTEVCGEREFYGEMRLSLDYASYKGLCDVPLNNKT